MIQNQTSIGKLQNYAINRQFFNIQKHKATYENSRKLITYYQRLSQQFQRSYKYIFDLPNKLKEILQQKNTKNNQLIAFKSFLRDFFDVFTIISDFQIESYSRLRSSNFDELDNHYDTFIFSIINYNKMQDDLQINKQKYIQINQQMKMKYKQLKQILKKPENNFNIKKLQQEIKLLSQCLQKKKKLQESISINIQNISENTKLFQQKLIIYRQKILKNKYQYLNKITKLSKNSKQSIIQIITYLYNYINTHKYKLLTNKFKEKQQFQNNSKLDLTELIIKCTTQYDNKIQNYLKILRSLESCFKNIGNQVKVIKNNHLEIIDLLMKENQYNQLNIQEINSSLDFYLIFFKNLSQLSEKIAYNQSNLVSLQKKIEKQKNITLSIVKYNIKNQKGQQQANMQINLNKSQKSSQIINKQVIKSQSPRYRKHSINSQSLQRNKDIQYIDSLFDQMNQYYISIIINKVSMDFKDTIVYIRNYFLQSQKPQKIITQDSMEMSHLSEKNYIQDRRPFKKQLWLWKQYRIVIKNFVIQTESIQKHLQKMQKYLLLQKNQQNEFQNLNCVFRTTTDIKGVLKLLPSSIRFSSINNKYQLFIPFDSIEKIDMYMNLINNTFTIQTIYGDLQFSDRTVGSIKKFFVSTQKAIDFYSENKGGEQVQEKVKVDLNEQDIQFINKRKLQIAKELQNINQYEHYNTIVLQNVRINDVYHVIYGDQKIVIKDKEYQCFLDSLKNKFQNFNVVYQKFAPIGPEFYSKVQGVNFRNCPVYSQRLVQMDHSLPKVPFFPAACHVKQNIKVFWVSHQQFHVLQKNVTSGAPYTENFYSVTLTLAQKVQNNVQLRFFFKIIDVTSFSLRSIIIPKVIDEIKKGNMLFCDQIKKIMMRYKIKTNQNNNKQRQSNQKAEESIFSQKTIVKQYKKTITNLQTKNKYLMYVLIAVFVLNLILNLII